LKAYCVERFVMIIIIIIIIITEQCGFSTYFQLDIKIIRSILLHVSVLSVTVGKVFDSVIIRRPASAYHAVSYYVRLN